MTSLGRYTLSKMRTFYSANQDGTAFKHVPVWNVFFYLKGGVLYVVINN